MKLIFSRNKDIPPFDAALRAALEALPADGDAAARDFAAFQSLQAAEEKKKRRRFLFWWILPAALLLAGGWWWCAATKERNVPATVSTGIVAPRPTERRTAPATLPFAGAPGIEAPVARPVPLSRKTTGPRRRQPDNGVSVPAVADTASVIALPAAPKTGTIKVSRPDSLRKKDKQDTLSIIW